MFIRTSKKKISSKCLTITNKGNFRIFRNIGGVYISNDFYLDLPLEIASLLQLYELECREGKFNDEQYVKERLEKAGIELTDFSLRQANDGGVDFKFFSKNRFYFIQLKWWFTKRMNAKKAKEIYGDMFFNEEAILCRKKEIEVKYFLVTPFVGLNTKKLYTEFESENYLIVTEENFVYFLNNPKYFFERV